MNKYITNKPPNKFPYQYSRQKMRRTEPRFLLPYCHCARLIALLRPLKKNRVVRFWRKNAYLFPKVKRIRSRMQPKVSLAFRAALFAAFIFAAVPADAYGQSSFSLGLKGGGNSNVFGGVDRPEEEPAFRGRGGLYVPYFFPKHFGLEAEGMHLGSGYDGNPNLEEVFFLDYGMGGLLAYYCLLIFASNRRVEMEFIRGCTQADITPNWRARIAAFLAI